MKKGALVILVLFSTVIITLVATIGFLSACEAEDDVIQTSHNDFTCAVVLTYATIVCSGYFFFASFT